MLKLHHYWSGIILPFLLSLTATMLLLSLPAFAHSGSHEGFMVFDWVTHFINEGLLVVLGLSGSVCLIFLRRSNFLGMKKTEKVSR
jgi:hypothetical protein